MCKAKEMEMVTVMECRHCDGTMSHMFMDVRVCISCGAEWTPVEVKRSYEDVYGSSQQEDAEECAECLHVFDDFRNRDSVEEYGLCVQCMENL